MILVERLVALNDTTYRVVYMGLDLEEPGS
jgi:hypothetical protein